VGVVQHPWKRAPRKERRDANRKVHISTNQILI
jgi:hypothetical protein